MRVRAVVAGVLVSAAACSDDPTAPAPPGPDLALGEVVTAAGSAAGTLRLNGGAGGAEFVYVALNGSEAASSRLVVEVTPGGIQAARLPVPSLRTAPGAAGEGDGGFHQRLRERERRELGGRLAAAAGAATPLLAPRRSLAAQALAPGDRLQLNTSTRCDVAALRTGQVVAVGQYSAVLADLANPAGGLTDADYRGIAAAFDQLIFPLNRDNFGAPTDIDSNGRVLIFFTSAVNELPAPPGTVIQGFHWAGDLFPRDSTPQLAGCRYSNQAEMFYLFVPDASRGLSVDFVREAAVGVVSHEFQHLINAGRRLYVTRARSFEETWLDEGLSHIAEELLFYRESGLQPRQNLDVARLTASQQVLSAFNRYQDQNLDRLTRYLQQPDTILFMDPDSDNLAGRGASWAFLRYAADRDAGGDAELWNRLVNSSQTGLDNLEDALGTQPLEWLHAWKVSLYTDDLVPGVEPRYTQPSWNFRSVLPALAAAAQQYPLQVRPLAAGVTSTSGVRAGGSVYFRFSVAPGATATLQTTVGGTTPPAQLRVAVARTR